MSNRYTLFLVLVSAVALAQAPAARAHDDEDITPDSSELHTGRHVGVHSGLHWSPEEGWHAGTHVGEHSGTHAESVDTGTRYDVHSGFHWSPQEGWHDGTHVGVHQTSSVLIGYDVDGNPVYGIR